jgi:hypothetical protein
MLMSHHLLLWVQIRQMWCRRSSDAAPVRKKSSESRQQGCSSDGEGKGCCWTRSGKTVTGDTTQECSPEKNRNTSQLTLSMTSVRITGELGPHWSSSWDYTHLKPPLHCSPRAQFENEPRAKGCVWHYGIPKATVTWKWRGVTVYAHLNCDALAGDHSVRPYCRIHSPEACSGCRSVCSQV